MKVHIFYDEEYAVSIRECDEPDVYPWAYFTVEVPDELIAQYNEAHEKLSAISQQIVKEYGLSEPDPDFPARLDAWREKHS
jgi:hypothetical protein